MSVQLLRECESVSVSVSVRAGEHGGSFFSIIYMSRRAWRRQHERIIGVLQLSFFSSITCVSSSFFFSIIYEQESMEEAARAHQRGKLFSKVIFGL